MASCLIRTGKVFPALSMVLLSYSGNVSINFKANSTGISTLENLRDGPLIDVRELKVQKNLNVDVEELLHRYKTLRNSERLQEAPPVNFILKPSKFLSGDFSSSSPMINLARREKYVRF